MRSLGSLLGILVLFANLACASWCAAPQPVPPPCHPQHDEGQQAKPCDQLSWAGEASPFLFAPTLTAIELPTRLTAVLSAAPVFLSRATSPSPPPIRRI